MNTEFEDFIAEHTAFVWRVLTHLGLHREQLEDVCQEVFMAALTGLSGFQHRSSVHTWLFGICRNVAQVQRRRSRAGTELPMAELPETVIQPAQEGELWIKQAHQRLIQALSHLDEDQRLVFILFEIEELTMQDVARELGLPVSTCYSRLYAAREKVHAELRRSTLCRSRKGEP